MYMSNPKFYVFDGSGRVVYRGGDKNRAISARIGLKYAGDPAAVIRRVEEDGYCPETGLYISRHYAKKAAYGDEVVVKVCGGWKIMKAADALVWGMQK